MPNITGILVRVANASSYLGILSANVTGVFQGSNLVNNCASVDNYTNTQGYMTLNFNASLSDSIYGSADTVQPPAINLIPQIKY